MDYEKVFVSRLLECIQQSGVNQTELARLTGVTKAAVSRWVNGISSPGLSEVCRLAKAFDVSLDWLTGLSDEKPAIAPLLGSRERALLVIVRAAASDPEGAAEAILSKDQSQPPSPPNPPHRSNEPDASIASPPSKPKAPRKWPR